MTADPAAKAPKADEARPLDEELDADVPGLAVAKKLYDQVAAKGWEDCGTQALYRLYTSL